MDHLLAFPRLPTPSAFLIMQRALNVQSLMFRHRVLRCLIKLFKPSQGCTSPNKYCFRTQAQENNSGEGHVPSSAACKMAARCRRKSFAAFISNLSTGEFLISRATPLRCSQHMPFRLTANNINEYGNLKAPRVLRKPTRKDVWMQLRHRRHPLGSHATKV